eukprot:1161480-Pelagomonas_calceolata.AAC.20
MQSTSLRILAIREVEVSVQRHMSRNTTHIVVSTCRTGTASAAAAALAQDDGPLLVLDSKKEERARKVRRVVRVLVRPQRSADVDLSKCQGSLVRSHPSWWRPLYVAGDQFSGPNAQIDSNPMLALLVG